MRSGLRPQVVTSREGRGRGLKLKVKHNSRPQAVGLRRGPAEAEPENR